MDIANCYLFFDFSWLISYTITSNVLLLYSHMSHQAIDAFAQLDRSDKITKLVHMLTLFVEYSQVARDTLSMIQQYPDRLSDDELFNTYRLFVQTVTSVSTASLETAVDYLATIHAKLLTIQEEEAADRSKENPDILLENI